MYNLNSIKYRQLYKKLNTNQIFNVNNSLNVNRQDNNLQNNISLKKRIRKQIHNLELNKNEFNDMSNNKVNSPILINNIRNFRIKYLNDNQSDDENNINFNLTKINNGSHLAKDKYNNLENTMLLKNTFSKDTFENINKKTNRYFYNNNNSLTN